MVLRPSDLELDARLPFAGYILPTGTGTEEEQLADGGCTCDCTPGVLAQVGSVGTGSSAYWRRLSGQLTELVPVPLGLVVCSMPLLAAAVERQVRGTCSSMKI